MKVSRLWIWYSLTAFLLLLIHGPLFSKSTVTLWHAYRGLEKAALESVAQSFNLSHADIQVSLLTVPFDAFFDKLNVTLPLGQGPDIFIGGYSGAGYWAEQGLVLPLESYFSPVELSNYQPKALQAFNCLYPEAIWGIPANTKSLALFYNKQIIQNPPRDMDELIKIARSFTRPAQGTSGRWGLAYETGNFYYHALWLHAFGGRMFTKLGVSTQGYPVFVPHIHSQAMKEAFRFYTQRLLLAGIMPPEPNNTLVTRLFNTGNALFVLNGQWFRGEITPRLSYGIQPVPRILEAPYAPAPFLTVEGYYLSALARNQLAAVEVIRYFSGGAMQKVMATQGKHSPVHKQAFSYAIVREDKINQVFVEIGKTAMLLPNGPEASLGWGPFTAALSDLQESNADQVLAQRQAELIAMIEKFRGRPGLFADMGYKPGNITQK